MAKILNVFGHVILLSGSRQKLILSLISLLLIIGRLFLAMAQMKACNFHDPHQNTYWILGQIGQKSDIASLIPWRYIKTWNFVIAKKVSKKQGND